MRHLCDKTLIPNGVLCFLCHIVRVGHQFYEGYSTRNILEARKSSLPHNYFLDLPI